MEQQSLLISFLPLMIVIMIAWAVVRGIRKSVLRIDAVCTKCSSKFNEIPKQSFLGFQKLTCPNCQEKLAYPLTKGYRTIYWVIFVLMAFMIVGAFSEGDFGFPSGFGLAVTFALLRDRSIRKRLSKTRESE